jgi:hypothetical protein
MYCSTCGIAVAQGLSYCKNCGANLHQYSGSNKSSELRPDFLVASMVMTFVFGLAVIAFLMGIMKAVLDMPVGQILGVIMVPFLMMFILEAVFITKLFSHKKDAAETKALEFAKQQATNELDAAPARALPEPLQSVTEHTTRAFEPLYNERKQS